MRKGGLIGESTSVGDICQPLGLAAAYEVGRMRDANELLQRLGRNTERPGKPLAQLAFTLINGLANGADVVLTLS